MEIVVGTYEQLLLGYKLHDNKTLKNSFTDHSHVGIVRCVTISDNGVLASGSSDEVIKLFSLTKRREVGTLMQHEGSINRVMFHGNDVMLSCSDDGTLAIWRVRTWECLRTLRGHKGAVNGASIHPSGKLALSVAADRTLRTWNLMTGKCAYITKLKTLADFVQWTPQGDQYFVVTNTTAELYSVETAKVVHTITCDFKIHVIRFLEDNIALITGEKGLVQFYDITNGEKKFEFSTDTIRIKGMELKKKDEDCDDRVLVTGSSDGHIKVWKVEKNGKTWNIDLISSVSTSFRIISLAINSSPLNKDAAVNDNESDSSENEEDNVSMDTDDDSENESESDEEPEKEVVKPKPKPKKKTVHIAPTKKSTAKSKAADILKQKLTVITPEGEATRKLTQKERRKLKTKAYRAAKREEKKKMKNQQK